MTVKFLQIGKIDHAAEEWKAIGQGAEIIVRAYCLCHADEIAILTSFSSVAHTRWIAQAVSERLRVREI